MEQRCENGNKETITRGKRKLFFRIDELLCSEFSNQHHTVFLPVIVHLAAIHRYFESRKRLYRESKPAQKDRVKAQDQKGNIELDDNV